MSKQDSGELHANFKAKCPKCGAELQFTATRRELKKLIKEMDKEAKKRYAKQTQHRQR